jgi:hypothetical protein
VDISVKGTVGVDSQGKTSYEGRVDFSLKGK